MKYTEGKIQRWTKARGHFSDALMLFGMCFSSHSKTKCGPQLGSAGYAVACMKKKVMGRGACVRRQWSESEMFQRVVQSDPGTQQREL